MPQVFISHASEDKEPVARPLAEELLRLGYDVWFDEFSLRVGDSLRSSIDAGLSESDHAVVVLSPSFFAKEWPQRELDGLFTREIVSGNSVVIPIWHKLTAEEVALHSPLLAGRFAAETSRGLPSVVRQIVSVLGDAKEGPDLEPRATLDGWHEVLQAFWLTGYDDIDETLADLHPKRRNEIEERFHEQEEAIRTLMAVGWLRDLTAPQRQQILAAFVPIVDPTSVSHIRSLLDQSEDETELVSVLDGFEILSTTPVTLRPDVEAMFNLQGPVADLVLNFAAQYLRRPLIAAAVEHELARLLTSPAHSFGGVLHILMLGTCNGTPPLPPFIPYQDGQFRKVMRGWSTQEGVEISEMLPLVQEMEGAGINPGEFNLPSLDQAISMASLGMEKHRRLLTAQTHLIKTTKDVIHKIIG